MAIPPVPYQTPLSGKDGIVTQSWASWFRAVLSGISSSTPSFTLPLSIANGGSGQSTQAAALTALTGPQSAGKYVRSDGSNASLSNIQAADVPTLNQNTTGTASNVTGTVAIANGGTGQTTQQSAIDTLTGAQSAGKYLRSDGTHATLAAIQAADVPTLNQNTTGTASNVTGTVAIANGGTGQITQQAALNALTGTQSSGKYLRSDGTNATLSTIQAGDVPTLNQNTTGTASNVTGTVAIANGGTGQITQQAAINALTGTQSSGKYLRSDGTNATLSSIQAADVPTLNQNTTGTAANVTGIVAVANGGTGQTSYTDGQLLIGNTATTGLTKATLTAGSNITITNGNGSITIAASSSSSAATLTPVTKTANYTIASTDGTNLIIADTSSGGFTLTLPAASGVSGIPFHIAKKGSNTLTIARSGSDTIMGETSQTIMTAYESVVFYSDGSSNYYGF